MFLATTALSEFWDKDRELLFLGQWCRLHEKRAVWTNLRGRVMPSPWDGPGALDRGAEQVSALHEALLFFLADFLNKEHALDHGEPYWRIILGPWLLGYTSAIVDHGMHLDHAFELAPSLETWLLDRRDRRTPIDTTDFASKVSTDIFHLQLYSEILEARGASGRTRSLTPLDVPVPTPSRAKGAGRAALTRAIRTALGPEKIFSDFYASPRQTLSLILATSFVPMGETVASPRVGVDAARRAGLAGFRAAIPYAAEAAALLPRHLPTLFLEGHAEFRRAVLARWPQLPRRLLTSVGWYSNETFKLLAAEAIERGAELVMSQHGGGYGMMDPLFSEAHERRISDRYLTWGWTDQIYPGAKLAPLPNPKLLSNPRRGGPRTGRWLMISTTLYRYPYSCYFASAPASHRFEDQIEDRAVFLRTLGKSERAALRMRLHHADLGWGHRARLTEEFPDLIFDEAPSTWTSRADDFDLIVIDHPQTSMLEALAGETPALLFWDPSLWRMRLESLEGLDGLRRAGILLDSPEDAARAIPSILADPEAWWARPEAKAARAAFSARFARSSPSWLEEWARVLNSPVNP